MPVELGQLLRDATLSGRLLAVFSESAITASLPLLAAAFGSANVFGAMLLDERAPIRTLGFDQIAGWDGFEPSDAQREEADRSLLLQFKPFLSAILPAFGGTFPAASATSIKPTHTRHDSKSAELVLKLRESRQEANRLRRQLELASAERAQAQSKLQEQGNALERAQSALSASSAAHESLSARFEQRVEQAVHRRLDERLLPWLQPAEALAQAVALAAPVDLLQSAQELLQQQAAIDRKFGLRTELADQITRCSTVLASLKAAMAESIRPLPGMAGMADRVQASITEIEATLGRTSTAPARYGQVPEQLAQKLGQARTLEDVAAVRSALLSIEMLGLLQDAEINAACALITDTASRLYHHAKLDRGVKGPRARLNGLPLFALQEKLADGEICTLVVDGHNILFQLPHLFAAQFERGQPGARA